MHQGRPSKTGDFCNNRLLFWLKDVLESWTVCDIGAEVAFFYVAPVLKPDSVTGLAVILSENRAVLFRTALFVCIPLHEESSQSLG